jgi:hypothetical protein
MAVATTFAKGPYLFSGAGGPSTCCETQASVPPAIGCEPALQTSPVAPSLFDSLRALDRPTSFKSSYPYLLCNELLQQEALHALSAFVAPSGERSAHIGFSVWLNYDIMAVTRPDCAVLCDIDGHVHTIYRGVNDCLAKSTNRHEFILLFQSFLEEHREEFWGIPEEDLPKICDIKAELTREGGWLSSDDRFATVKRMHDDGRVAWLWLDITDSEGRFEALSKWLTEKGLILGTLYVSNIVEWLEYSGLSALGNYVRNLQTIARERTLFLDAYRCQMSTRPLLHVGQGKESIRIPPKRHRRGFG